MVDLKSHIEEIDKNYANSYFAQYMLGKWGVKVGFKTQPLWFVNFQKSLADYQILAIPTCDNSLFLQSQGHVSYNCCPDNYTKTEQPGPLKCCPDGYVYRNSDGMCGGGSPLILIDPIACPCCPNGYVWDTSISKCTGVSSYDAKDPIVCGYDCVSPTGIVSKLTACPDLEPDSLLVSAPQLDPCNNTCYEGVTWCNVTPAPIVVNRVINVSGSDVSIEQFEVGTSDGPISGATTFTPLLLGRAYLVGKTSIEVAVGTVLTLGTDYTFDNTTGTITLLLGRLFNPGEVYTITAF